MLRITTLSRTLISSNRISLCCLPRVRKASSAATTNGASQKAPPPPSPVTITGHQDPTAVSTKPPTNMSLPTQINAIRFKGGKATATQEPMPAIGPKDVVLKITHSGVCHTDMVYKMMGSSASLGHEGVGTVIAVGSDVTKFKVGDVAGSGFIRDSCGDVSFLFPLTTQHNTTPPSSFSIPQTSVRMPAGKQD